jgi:hypothetical protein
MQELHYPHHNHEPTAAAAAQWWWWKWKWWPAPALHVGCVVDARHHAWFLRHERHAHDIGRASGIVSRIRDARDMRRWGEDMMMMKSFF